MPREQLFEQQAVVSLEAEGHVAGVLALRTGMPVEFVASITTPAGGHTATLLLHQLIQ
jgi:hypothetical protein